MSKENEKIAKLKVKISLFYDKVGALTKLQRLLICFVTFALIGGGYYYFILMPKQDQLTKVRKIYDTQSKKLIAYKRQAAALAEYEKMMAEAQGKFNQAMLALPDKREIPSLLTGISRAGGDAGLVFHLFKPESEIQSDYYKEIPVSIKVEGRYHQLTDFFHQVVRLNRIVNIDNVSVTSKSVGNNLQMSCRAVTYMFAEKKDPETTKNGPKRKK